MDNGMTPTTNVMNALVFGTTLQKLAHPVTLGNTTTLSPKHAGPVKA